MLSPTDGSSPADGINTPLQLVTWMLVGEAKNSLLTKNSFLCCSSSVMPELTCFAMPKWGPGACEGRWGEPVDDGWLRSAW